MSYLLIYGRPVLFDPYVFHVTQKSLEVKWVKVAFVKAK